MTDEEAIARAIAETEAVTEEISEEITDEEAAKDAKEAEMMATLKAEAQKELNEWYKRYDDNLAKTKEDNRQHELEFINGVNDIKPGTEWERVNKLCDFRHVSGKNVSVKSDTSRMKSILLQLKQQESIKDVN